MKSQTILFSLIVLALGMGACQPAISSAPVSQKGPEKMVAAALVIPTEQPQPTSTSPLRQSTPVVDLAPEPQASATLLPASSASQNIGPNPENIPPGYNPLTGLPVVDQSLLQLPAVLISITNFPPSARPQAGLSFSPWVFEIYIAEGMTRYLAAFYGAFPHIPTGANTSADSQPAPNPQVGPVRSGRLPYVYIRDFFQNSCLVYASATVEIRAKLRGCAMVFGTDSTNPNSAMLDVTRLQKIAQENQAGHSQFNYTGNLFSASPQTQGAPANQINVYYSLLNQAQWHYEPASGEFLKFDDFADGSGKFTPATDRINGNQLAFSNVVVLYTEHTVISPYIMDVKMGPGEVGKAVIFRDGQKFNVFWSTVSGAYEQTTGLRRPLRFQNADGSPFALKPGQTWIHIVTLPSAVQDKGDGLWNLRFYAPAGAK